MRGLARCDYELVPEDSGIADAKGRVGTYPGRIEAEAMQLKGYAPVDVKPFEAASGSKAVYVSGRRRMLGIVTI